MIFFDTAYVIKVYLREPRSELVRHLAAGTEGVAISAWTRVEFAYAAHRHFRENKLTLNDLIAALDLFADDIAAGRWILFPLSESIIYASSNEVRNLPVEIRLRAGDAIQLASAREHGVTEIYTNDKQLLAAAPHFGLNGVNIL